MQLPGQAERGGSALILRRMAPSDVVGVREVLSQSPESALWSESGILESCRNGIGWVAERDGQIAGFLMARVITDEFEILNMAVGRQHRREGIASGLIQRALEWALIAEAKSVHLEVRESNVAAISLYSRHGFKVIGRRERYYHDPIEDALLLLFSVGGTH